MTSTAPTQGRGEPRTQPRPTRTCRTPNTAPTQGREEPRTQPQPTRTRPTTRTRRSLPAQPPEGYAAFAFVAYMSTYSCPDNRMTSVITESVTARSTYRSRSIPS